VHDYVLDTPASGGICGIEFPHFERQTHVASFDFCAKFDGGTIWDSYLATKQ
jgi:hypothetical protein